MKTKSIDADPDLVTKKHNEKAVKPRWDLIPFEQLSKVADVMSVGAKDHDKDGWQKYSSDDHFASLMRHITSWRNGEILDEEDNLPHTAHAICRLLFLMWIDENQKISKKGES